MQLGQVGRDQAAERDALLKSSMQSAAQQVKQVEQKEAVREPEEPKDGPQAIKDRQGGQANPNRKRQPDEGPDVEPEPDEEVIRDPSLGNTIDLTG
jgi:hypothetical protein